MKVQIIGPSFCGKSTAHEQKKSFDLEEHPEYRARKKALDWNKDVPGRKMRGQFYEVAYAVAVSSNFPIISTHPMTEMKSSRRLVAAIKTPTWELLDNPKTEAGRFLASAMGYAKIAISLARKDEITAVEGYVGDVVNELFADGVLSSDDWDLEMDRVGAALIEGWSALDSEYGYTATEVKE